MHYVGIPLSPGLRLPVTSTQVTTLPFLGVTSVCDKMPYADLRVPVHLGPCCRVKVTVTVYVIVKVTVTMHLSWSTLTILDQVHSAHVTHSPCHQERMARPCLSCLAHSGHIPVRQWLCLRRCLYLALSSPLGDKARTAHSRR
jgi:hypothetical protein